MPVYSNSTTQNKFKNKNLTFKLGLTFLIIFSVLLINLIFNIISPVNSFLLGFFGLSIYGIFLSLIIYSILLILNKRIKYSFGFIILCILNVFMIISAIHVLTTASMMQGVNYGEFLKLSYAAKITAGGLFLSIFSYLFYFIFGHYITVFCVYAIAIIVLTSLIIYKVYLASHNIEFKSNKQDNIKTNEKMMPASTEKVEKTGELEEKSIITEKTEKFDDSIFVKDEAFDNTNSNESDNEEKLKAKSMLGLLKDDSNKEIDASFDGDSNKTLSNNSKPQKFVHNIEDEYAFKPTNFSKNFHKKLSDTEKRNLEFLRATRGEKLAEMNSNSNKSSKVIDNIGDSRSLEKNNIKNQSGLSANNILNQNNKVPINNQEPKIEFTNENYKQEKFNLNSVENNNEVKFDLYDENLTLKEFNNNQTSFKEKYNNLNNKINSFGGGIKAAQKVYTGEANENIVESKSFNKPEIKPIKTEIEKPIKKEFKPAPYIKPPTDLLKYSPNVDRIDDSSEQEEKARALEEVLQSFKIPATVQAIVKGPTFTRYEMKMPPGIPVSRIFSYQNDIKMQLMTNDEIRIEAPIPGKSAFGIEVVNDTKDIVCLRDIIESNTFTSSKSPLTFVLGKDIVGDCKISKLDKAPHLLVAGSTGSGKSVCLNALIISLLYKNDPDNLKMILVDPKKVEMSMYNGLPHMLIPNAITDIDKAICAFEWLITEMERRYAQFTEFNVRDIASYNENPQVVAGIKPKMPYLVLIVDEVADIMSQAQKEIENRINRLAAKSRAAGIHIVLATQRPSTDVITGLIKNNLPTRIAFKVTSMPDSKTILDRGGAEKLIGKGDMLYMSSDGPNLTRIQGALVSDGEVSKVTNFIRENNDAFFDSDIEDEMFNKKANSFEAGSGLEEEYDPKLVDALRIVIKHNNVSISGLQRVLSLGYPRAGKIVDQMERLNFISPPDNKNKRTIFITAQEFEEKFGEEL